MLKQKIKEIIDILTSGDLNKAATVMKEILSDKELAWSENYGWRYIPFDKEYVHDNYNWSHGIEGVHLNSNGVVVLDIYWQGDRTDGTEHMPLWNAINGNNTISGRWYDDGKCERYPITVERKELVPMFKEVARLMSDDEVQKRKDGKKRQAVFDRIFPEFYRRFEAGFFGGNPRAHNGYEAVCALVDAEWRQLQDLTEDELWAIVMKVRNQNYKFDHEFSKIDGKNQYNLNFKN